MTLMPASPPTDADCIFCKIVAGDIPCHRLYEDDHVLAFLDIQPLLPGHAMVIPKAHAATLTDLAALDPAGDYAAATGRAIARLAPAIALATGTADYNILQNNGRPAHQEVPHVHFHIIPKPGPDAGLGIDWPKGSLPHEEAQRLATAIQSSMERFVDLSRFVNGPTKQARVPAAL